MAEREGLYLNYTKSNYSSGFLTDADLTIHSALHSTIYFTWEPRIYCQIIFRLSRLLDIVPAGATLAVEGGHGRGGIVDSNRLGTPLQARNAAGVR